MIEIKPLRIDQIEDAKALIIEVALEVWQWPVTAVELRQRWDEKGLLADLDVGENGYFGCGGTFLALRDNEKIVGTGAIRPLGGDICELKRMYFLRAYRGRGLGMQMARMLLHFASAAGYKKVRLDTGDDEKQAAARKLYQRLGFYDIERYNDGPCTAFMEKTLE